MQSKLATLTLFLIFLAGCSTTPRETTLYLAKSSGFTEVRFPTEQFTLFGQFRPSDHGERKTLRVYIEGDGHAWSTRTRPSGDPTPRDPWAYDWRWLIPVMIRCFTWRVRASSLQGVTYGTVLRNIGHPPALRQKLSSALTRPSTRPKQHTALKRLYWLDFQAGEEQQRCWLPGEPT